MKPPPFDYIAVRSIDEALDQLAQGGEDARVLAGGQSLVPMLALRLARPSLLVDLNRVGGLAGAKQEGAELRVGAMTRQCDILRDPLVAKHAPALSQASAFIGHEQTRNRGTIGGSLGLCDPQSEYPAVALALGAQIEARSKQGVRRIPAQSYFQGAYSTDLKHGEIITSVIFPHWGEGTSMLVDEVARRPGDFALVGLVMALQSERGRIKRAGIAWFGMGPKPCRAAQAEKALIGEQASKIDAAAIGQLALAETEPWDDVHATASYRRTVGARIAARNLRKLLGTEAKA